jgi:hypothetical protein
VSLLGDRLVVRQNLEYSVFAMDNTEAPGKDVAIMTSGKTVWSPTPLNLSGAVNKLPLLR